MTYALTADALAGIPHGFFTRGGGVSVGVYAGLNCGEGSGDDPEAVAENRALVAEALGADELVSVHQIHSATAVMVDGPHETTPQADAMVATRPGLAIGVLTADCAPVLMADAHAGVVAAAHAGWRGALAGVTDAALDLMVERGARRARIATAIGPTISQAAYEVGPEFMDEFTADDPDNTRFFAGGEGDRMRFDLPGYLLERLRGVGVASAEWTGHCTVSDPSRFYSYRRGRQAGESDYGRLIAAIMAPAR